jgi:hypothetical protein
MRIQVDLSTLGQTKGHDYAVRFLFGGLITAIAGIIAKKFGPGIGGLFRKRQRNYTVDERRDW